MNVLRRILNAIAPPPPAQSAEHAAREAIRQAPLSNTIRSQALARFNRRMALRQPVDEALHAVMAWAESVS